VEILRIAAFSDGETGGNPAGVVIGERHPPDEEMRRIAAEVGFSETAFAMPQGAGWRVRHFSPASGGPVCGPAAVGLGAAPAAPEGHGAVPPRITRADNSGEGAQPGDVDPAAAQTRPTSGPAQPWRTTA